ncbi:UDP-N-acetylmuramoyl-L-alanine--D-glutamate ligase [Persephonella sp.]
MVLIYGKGTTGQSLARFMERNEIPHILRDDEDFSEDDLEKVSLIVISPGIPFYHNIYRLARKKGIEIIGDIEYAYRLYRGKIFAITGTDGKSTTTYILGELLKKENPFVGGNYGQPFINAVLNKNPVAVLELSSFQIYATQTFRPNTGVLLNVSVDHLDWHKRESHYLLSKYKMFKRMGRENTAILNLDQEIIQRVKIQADRYYFSMERLPRNLEGIYHCGQFLIYKIKNKTGKIDITDFKLEGVHNIQNLMAASLAAMIHGVSPEEIEEVIPNLKPLPYRIQPVGEVKGVRFYNDSKSTTIQSVEKAVASFKDSRVILIIGGIYKGGDFSVLLKYPNIKKIIIYGRDRQVLKQMLEDRKDIVLLKETLEDSVKEAYRQAEKGDVVLFSPGCSSFDMFKNYRERGEVFNKLVESIGK